MAARAPRVKDRPVGRAARGIAVIRGVRHSGVEPSSQVWQHQHVRLSLRDSCWQALLVVLLFHCPLSAVARGETRHVLVLSSSERPFAPQSGFADALVRELIRSSREPIRFVEVSVQAARASDEAPDARLRSAYGSRLGLRGWTWS